jgi:hypothetical protein
MSEKGATAPIETKWYQHKAFTFYAVASIAVSLMMIQQNCNIEREQARINDRLDYQDAHRSKGLIDGAKAREAAYFELKNYYERVLMHCKTARCDLPNELAVLPAERKFESLDSLLLKEKKE